jgi:transcriptional regulator with XRE-family HTH domain
MFWNNFEALCAEKGISYNAAAADVGVKSSGTVTGWKNGAKPRGPVLKRLADYFDVTVEELTGENEQKEKPSTAGEIDLSGLSPDDAELVKLLLKAPEAKKNAIRALL